MRTPPRPNKPPRTTRHDDRRDPSGSPACSAFGGRGELLSAGRKSRICRLAPCRSSTRFQPDSERKPRPTGRNGQAATEAIRICRPAPSRSSTRFQSDSKRKPRPTGRNGQAATEAIRICRLRCTGIPPRTVPDRKPHPAKRGGRNGTGGLFAGRMRYRPGPKRNPLRTHLFAANYCPNGIFCVYLYPHPIRNTARIPC